VSKPRASTPTRLFRTVAIAEAITWTGLLLGMFLKYVTETTEAGVRVFGMLHGVVFVAYVVTTVVVWVDRRWSAGRGLLTLLAAIPPLVTLPLEWWAVRKGWLGDEWRLPAGATRSLPDRGVAWLLANPLRGLGVGVVAVAVLTGLALVVGPPTS
jgi:integral membrane protein